METYPKNADSTDMDTDNWSAWKNIKIREASFITAVHLMSLYGLYLSFLNPWFFLQTIGIMYVLIMFGVNIGAHRYYAHKAFTANLPLRIILNAAQAYNGQNTSVNWALEHRAHHKSVDTDGDPHNAQRGIFFAQIGWIMCDRHPKAQKVKSQVDLSDLKDDAVAMHQEKYYLVWYVVTTLLVSFLVPHWQGASLQESFFIAYILRYVLGLHVLGAVNSYAHHYGTKSYDKNIFSTNNRLIGFFANCDGWHNFHHVFPWDYRSSELGIFNPSALVIDALAAIGWVTHRKVASPVLIARTATSRGDGSAPLLQGASFTADHRILAPSSSKRQVTADSRQHADYATSRAEGLSPSALPSKHE